MKKSLYKTGSFNSQLLLGIISVGMILASIYLTKHFFDITFPSGISGSICNINSYLNCDITLKSPLSRIGPLPISVFGIIFGFILLSGFLWREESLEGTNYFLVILNGIGCCMLLFYSIFFLKGICPFCFLYYTFSLMALFLFWKTSSILKPSAKILIIYSFAAMIPSYLVADSVMEKEQNKEAFRKGLISQFQNLPILGDPDSESPNKLTDSSTLPFKSAPVRISIFSDFQCPMCRFFSETAGRLAKEYAGKIQIQYFFYPLDRACNPSMKHDMHLFACKASYLANCVGPSKFKEVHDYLFVHQEEISDTWLDKYAANLGPSIKECMAKLETQKIVLDQIKSNDRFSLTSTPTIILNGRKIEGNLPYENLAIIIDSLSETGQENQKK